MVAALIERVAGEDPDSLGMLLELQAQLADGLAVVVERQRAQGATDAEIAAALGVSRQAVSKRWPGGGRYQGAAGRYRSR